MLGVANVRDELYLLPMIWEQAILLVMAVVVAINTTITFVVLVMKIKELRTSADFLAIVKTYIALQSAEYRETRKVAEGLAKQSPGVQSSSVPSP